MQPIFLFWIILALIVGGVVLLYPLASRLGKFLDDWIAIRRAEQEGSRQIAELVAPQIERLGVRVEELERGQRRLEEQQEFMQSLLESGGAEGPRVVGPGE